MADLVKNSLAHADDHAAPGDDEHGHGGIRTYVWVAVALAVLTSASFLTYFPFWDQHVSVNVSRAFMMSVSCAKAMLVLMFFMHLLWEANWKYVLTIPAAMMSVFLVMMLIPDVGRRTQKYSSQRWLHAAEPRLQDAHASPPAQEHAEDAAAATSRDSQH